MNAEFLAIYLRSSLVVNQTRHLMTGNTLPRLQTEDINRLPVPLIANAVQLKVVSLYNEANYKRQQKNQQAAALLASIDGYLLGELGITLPERDNRLEKRMFYVNSREVTGRRFDSPFYQVDVHLMCEQLKAKNHAYLNQLIEFSGETWNQHDYFDTVFPYIEISEIDLAKGTIENTSQIEVVDAPSRAKMVVREFDILVSLTRPTRGAIALNLHKGINIASTGFAVLRNFADSTPKCNTKN